MAIDTKAKRMSMLYVASPVVWGAHFEVDGTVDADDRAHLLHLYGGNALGSPVIPVVTETRTVSTLLTETKSVSALETETTEVST